MKNVSLSLKTYMPLLESKTFWKYLTLVCALICCYWAFIGMGSILYVEGFGVSLRDFGFYQGAIAASFAIVSFLSPKLLSKFGHQKCFKVAIILVTIFAVLLGTVAISEINNPMLITVLMCLFTMPMVFPVNILYPLLLEVVPEAKSRAAALVNVTRLIVSAICIEVVSYFYDGRFLQLGLTIAALSILALIISKYVNHWKNE